MLRMILIIEMNVYHPAVFSTYLRDRSERVLEPLSQQWWCSALY